MFDQNDKSDKYKRKCINYRTILNCKITDSGRLSELKKRVDSLILTHGPDAKIVFTIYQDLISDAVDIEELETDEEYRIRLEQEIFNLKNKIVVKFKKDSRIVNFIKKILKKQSKEVYYNNYNDKILKEIKLIKKTMNIELKTNSI